MKDKKYKFYPKVYQELSGLINFCDEEDESYNDEWYRGCGEIRIYDQIIKEDVIILEWEGNAEDINNMCEALGVYYSPDEYGLEVEDYDEEMIKDSIVGLWYDIHGNRFDRRTIELLDGCSGSHFCTFTSRYCEECEKGFDYWTDEELIEVGALKNGILDCSKICIDKISNSGISNGD